MSSTAEKLEAGLVELKLVALAGWSCDVCWFCPANLTVGVRFRLGKRVVCYSVLKVEDWPSDDECQQALDSVRWVGKPPVGWDVQHIGQLGTVHNIGRKEAAAPRTKKVRARKRRKE